MIGRTLRGLRHRRGLRQRDVAARASIARSVLSELEAGRLGRHPLDYVERAAAAVGATLRIEVSVPGGDLRRLLDADHAALQARWATELNRHGWSVDAEVTFNHYGERGSIDLLGWNPAARVVLVVEVKTVIVDVQALLAAIDRKARIGRALASDRGWTADSVVPALLVREGSTARRRLAEHASLFGRFSLRGRSALAWLRDPTAGGGPMRGGGLLVLTKLPAVHPGDRRRAGRQRVRSLGGDPRS